jgi:O-antigen ligase
VLYKVFTFLVFVVGAASLAMPRGYSLGFFLICILGLILWLPKREILIDDKNRWLIWPCLIYASGHMAIGLMHLWAWRTFDPYVPFLLMAFGVWAIRKYKPASIFFWCGLALGAVLAACIAGYQAEVLGVRADGFNHAIQFGNSALLMGILCLVRLLMVRGRMWMDVLMALGFFAGLAASVWSQTRGGWLAMLLIVVWMLIKATQDWHPAKRLMAAIALLFVFAIPAMQTNGIVQTRVMAAMSEIEGYVSSKVQGNSVGARLAMWEFAYKNIANAPLIGQGVQGWKQNRDAGIKSGALDPFMQDFSHLHNEFLDVTYKTGLFGLALLMVLYGVPMLRFFNPYLQGYGADVKSLAMGGMVLPMIFMDFGLTTAFLSHNSGRMMFVSMLMCLGALLLNAAETSCQSARTDSGS